MRKNNIKLEKKKYTKTQNNKFEKYIKTQGTKIHKNIREYFHQKNNVRIIKITTN